MADLPPQIAAVQWNNRLKTICLMTLFILAMALFSFSFIMQFALPFLILPFKDMTAESLFHDRQFYTQFIKYFLQVLIFSIGGALAFIRKDIDNAGRVFSAHPLKLKPSDAFHRQLENLCISRGLRTPDLYVFNASILPKHRITAAVMQGLGGKSALIVSQAAVSLPDAEREALLAQAVQRLYTKDTFFLTLFCFLGFFPYHLLRSWPKIVKYIFGLPLWVADKAMSPVRPLLLDLRLARLDAGSLELTKDADAMASLLKKLATVKELKESFHAPYVAMFVAQTEGSYRRELLGG